MSAHEAPEAQAPAQPRFVRDLDTLIRARYPLLYLVSWEEQRIEGILQDLAAQHGKVLFSWSIARGLRRIGGAGARPPLHISQAPPRALPPPAKPAPPAPGAPHDPPPHPPPPPPARAPRHARPQPH